MKWEDIVTVGEIARRAGVEPVNVYRWRTRYDSFPAPRLEYDACVLWFWPEVERWLANKGLPKRPRGGQT